MLVACGGGNRGAPDAMVDAPPPCPDCQLTAIAPGLVQPGGTVTLEGTFVEPLAVTFPGEVTVAAMVLGSHRASVSVPANATQGVLTVRAGSTALGPIAFRRTGFTLTMKPFETTLVQASQPRAAVGLATPSSGALAVVLGDALYVVGGAGAADLASVDRALINADGSLGAFARVPGLALNHARSLAAGAVIGKRLYVTGGVGVPVVDGVEYAELQADGSLGAFHFADVLLTTQRYAHSAAVIGNQLYLVGGNGPAGTLASVERATIALDGSLGPFSAVPEAALRTARSGHTSAVIGNHLYVVGGAGATGALASVERAEIQPDGSLAAFEVVASALATPRSGHTMAVLGDAVYVHGGLGAGGGLGDVERAAIQADGSLGAFAALPGVALATPRFAAASALVGNYLYVIGGQTSGAIGVALGSLERASLIAGGTLGELARSPAGGIVQDTAAVVAIGSAVYAIGGSESGLHSRYLDRVARTTFGADGTPTEFATVPGIALVHGREGHSCAVIGNHLYVLGGRDASGALPTERAEIHDDGTLGPFADVAPTISRAGHTTVLHGDSLYLFGGQAGPGAATIDRVVIAADGTLGPAVLQAPVYNPPTQAAGNTSLVVGDHFYAIGGIGPDGLPQSGIYDSTFAADGTPGGFALHIGSGEPRAMQQAVVLGDQLIMFGGITVDGAGNIVQMPGIGQRLTLYGDGTVSDLSFFTYTSPLSGSPLTIGNYVYLIGPVIQLAPILTR